MYSLHQLWSTGWNEKLLNGFIRDWSDDPLHHEWMLYHRSPSSREIQTYRKLKLCLTIAVKHIDFINIIICIHLFIIIIYLFMFLNFIFTQLIIVLEDSYIYQIFGYCKIFSKYLYVFLLSVDTVCTSVLTNNSSTLLSCPLKLWHPLILPLKIMTPFFKEPNGPGWWLCF